MSQLHLVSSCLLKCLTRMRILDHTKKIRGEKINQLPVSYFFVAFRFFKVLNYLCFWTGIEVPRTVESKIWGSWVPGIWFLKFVTVLSFQKYGLQPGFGKKNFQGPGVKKPSDPGSGPATLLLNSTPFLNFSVKLFSFNFAWESPYLCR